MLYPTLAVAISTGALLIVFLLFRFEERRGSRVGESLRVHLDFALLKALHAVNVRFRVWSRYFLRQILHYFIHTLLTSLVRRLGALESRLKQLARSNRALAKRSDRERTERTKLEEIAIHKMEVALSDEEKRMRRHRSLEG